MPTYEAHALRETDELVARATAGDRNAFDQLILRFRPRIFALALHMTGSESEADDVTQESFISAYKNIQRFQGRSQFFTWLYRIAVNRSLNNRRNRKRRRETDLEDPRITRAVAVDAPNNPARAAELRQTYARLLRELDKLSPTMKTTVVLVALQGLSQAEAAVIQGCSPGTVAWRMHVARKRLSDTLSKLPLRPIAEEARRGISTDLSVLLERWGLPLFVD